MVLVAGLLSSLGCNVTVIVLSYKITAELCSNYEETV
jgi:hypothetical protein